MQLELVDEPGAQRLLNDVGAAANHDILVTRRGLSPSGTGDYPALDLTVVELNSHGQIRELTSFVEPKLFGKFGLPERLS